MALGPGEGCYVQHDHTEYVPGCFRCDLSRAELDEGFYEDDESAEGLLAAFERGQ